MNNNILKVKFYNDQTGDFEESSLLTSSEAVIMTDGETVEKKITDIQASGVAGFPVISSTAPSNPVDGQLWFEPV